MLILFFKITSTFVLNKDHQDQPVFGLQDHHRLKVMKRHLVDFDLQDHLNLRVN